jgi:hypothetical protein
MADNDDYMSAKATDDTVSELMWDRLQEGINANRRYRLKQVGGGGDFTYATGTLTWTAVIYIFFTRESDNAWVYNTVAVGNKSALSNNDVLYVTLNDTTTTVLTVSSAAYGSMPTDDTGRILVLGSIINSLWSTPYFGVSTYDSNDFNTDFAAKDTNDLSEGTTNKYFVSHDNTYHSPNYATETALSSHETSTGTSHTYIGQDVSSTASPGWVKIYMSAASHATVDTDKFCCIDSGGEVKYRNGSELLADIDVSSATSVTLNTTHRGTTTGNPHSLSFGDLSNVSSDVNSANVNEMLVHNGSVWTNEQYDPHEGTFKLFISGMEW